MQIFGLGISPLMGHSPRTPPPPGGFALQVAPSASWNGIAGSGFQSPPSDPVRTTAKPAIRLIVPPNQYFTDTLTIGVMAAANDGGSMIQSLGLQKVRVYFEDDTPTDIPVPSFRTFADANGVPVTYLGWWITLRKPEGISGHGHVYFEAVPRDPTMQSRVIGPYQFSPQDALHDYEIEVAASGPIVPGERYQTIKAAQSWLRDQGAENPLITITESANYVLERYNNSHGQYVGEGYCTIRASVPVTIGHPGPFVNNITAQARTFYDGMRFVGNNITLDFQFMDAIYSEGGYTGRQHWFDGVTIMNGGGHYMLWRGLHRTFNFCRYRPWITECDISDLPNMVNGANLVRGCYLHGGYSDCATDAMCVIGNRIHNWNSRPYIDELPALTVQYIGPGATATLDLAGNSIANNRTLTAKVDGSTVGSFTITNTEAGWLADTNYTVQNVVDWLNSLPGWTATLDSDERAAGALSKLNGKGGPFTGLDVKTAPTQLVTMIDLHADFWQLLEDYSYAITARENRIVMDNVLTEFAGQKIFLSAGTVEAHDMMFLNNAMHDLDDTGYQDETILFSQLARNKHSHVVIAHNSMMQTMVLRTDVGYDPDGYCLIANNALKGIVWSAAADSDLVLANNHLFSGQTIPAYATGTTVGGDETTLFADLANGNASPAGELLANPKPSVLAFDLAQVPRIASAPAGSRAL